MNLPLVGMSFGVGLLIGLTGMGGAALMAPLLILVLGVKPVSAVGTDLVYGAVTKIVGACIHLKQGTVDVPLVRRLALGSIPGGLAGSLLVIALPHYVKDAQTHVQRAIGVVLVLVALMLLWRMVFPQAPPREGAARLRWFEGRGTVIWGAVVGFCVGATSVGSGTLLAPFLLLLYPKKTARAVGTDVFHGAVLVTATAMVHAFSSVEWNLVPSLLAGSLPGVALGSRTSVWLPQRVIRAGMAALLLFAGYRML